MNFLKRWLSATPQATPEEQTAPIARQRLQVLLAHERASPGQGNLLGLIKEDVLTAIKKHVRVSPDDVKVRLERRKSISTMRISLDLPS
jgi:cell division topological specificity factor